MDFPVSEGDLAEIGRKLQIDSSGTVYKSKCYSKENNRLVYFKVPSTTSLVVLQSGVIIPFNSNTLLSLCEKRDAAYGKGVSWSCKVKESSSRRMNARCSFAGEVKASRGEGKRNRVSKKTNCPASVSTVALKKEEQHELDEVLRLDPTWKHDGESTFCIVKTINFYHNDHPVEKLDPGQEAVLKSSDILQNSYISEPLRRFISVVGSEKGATLRALRFLKSTCPSSMINYETLRNAIQRMRNDGLDASKLISNLSEMKKNGRVEYLSFDLAENNVLNSVTWSFKGSRDVVQRCGDVLYWDSTHNMTPFSYKLASLTLVDSEMKSRPVMFRLGLSETVKDCSSLIDSWHSNYEMKFPEIVFSDGDEGIYGSICGLSYHESVTHLLCTFHIFDLNAKKKLSSVLSSLHGPSTWIKFREELRKCQQCISEDMLQRIWNELLRKWIPKSKATEGALKYMNNFIWPRRTQWCVAFFVDKLTFGSSTTQRSESWNNNLKLFDNCLSMTELVESIELLVERQSTVERKSGHSMFRMKKVDPKIKTNAMIHQYLIDTGLSQFCCGQICEEVQGAVLYTSSEGG